MLVPEELRNTLGPIASLRINTFLSLKLKLNIFDTVNSKIENFFFPLQHMKYGGRNEICNINAVELYYYQNRIETVVTVDKTNYKEKNENNYLPFTAADLLQRMFLR